MLNASRGISVTSFHRRSTAASKLERLHGRRSRRLGRPPVSLPHPQGYPRVEQRRRLPCQIGDFHKARCEHAVPDRPPVHDAQRGLLAELGNALLEDGLDALSASGGIGG